MADSVKKPTVLLFPDQPDGAFAPTLISLIGCFFRRDGSAREDPRPPDVIVATPRTTSKREGIIKISPMVLGKEEIMIRLLVSCLPIGVLILSVSAFAEDPYQNPPVYGPDAQLEDLRSMAELVVLGTTGDRRIDVEEVLFGKPMEQMDARSTVPLGISPRVPPGRTGVWFLVRGPDGYAPINPDCTPVLPTAFRALPKPADHWTSRANLAANRTSDSQLYYQYAKPGTEDMILHGTNVYRFSEGDLIVELNIDEQEQLSLLFDSVGYVRSISKHPPEGHGFSLSYQRDALWNSITSRI